MIGKIKGKLIETDQNIGLIETDSGISYSVYITPSVISSYKINSAIELYTHLQVREDALVLFGFLSKNEYLFFIMLLSVPGIGPKTAFLIISFSKIAELTEAIKRNNVDYFAHIPGLGKKTAMKIILELSQKLKSEFTFKNLYLSEEDKLVIDALISLGFKSQQARSLFNKIPKNLPVEDRIKQALKLVK